MPRIGSGGAMGTLFHVLITPTSDIGAAVLMASDAMLMLKISLFLLTEVEADAELLARRLVVVTAP